ncbi:MAG: hypothetical protein ACR2MB_17360 [Acidimicrobiales bacterium]
MHRTNIYLTDEQDRALRARAQVDGTTKSAVIRSILDRELMAPAISAEVAQGFAELAERWDELTDGLFDDDPDLRIDR